MAKSSKVQVTFHNGIWTRAVRWPGSSPVDSTIRSLLFREIAGIEVE